MRIKETILILLLGLLISCAQKNKEVKKASILTENPTKNVLLYKDIQWGKLNPARGDNSPLAATLWGDRNAEVPTGFLAKFKDGFSSPPHIHNVTYRAVVIKGMIHNDDPKAEFMWMKPGSFWTQPVGEPHITAAKGNVNIALVEIDKGPYLVKPLSEAKSTYERPINIDYTNVVWLGYDQTNWISKNSKALMSFLWEKKEGKSFGCFIKLPPRAKIKLMSMGEVFHSVVIKGEVNYLIKNKMETLVAGSYFTSQLNTFHQLENKKDKEVVLYIKTNDKMFIEGI
ncbi:DUF4437 domain-containing protein [Flammeovirga sp. EKP202]|uniref:DUF4437 domain-containing protein n=1 Tax=Flammeovirga sp. EKP202 TaxID=2770592 RepID=UPI00165F9E4E|nr:DUF4437 domain-containing protein [Flammeovirga sp. EKP202]MBD0403958.1 DUF4437 domain-containing protein [Flammeovirga sp. EKP202]